PQNIAVRGAHEQGALTDTEMRERQQGYQPWLKFTNAVYVALGKLVERSPPLPRRRNVLPLILTYRTRRRRLCRWLVLGPAGVTDEGPHRIYPFVAHNPVERRA